MVYFSKFVTCVLVNGQVQKELSDGIVPIHFGAEYSLRFRNKNDRRAVVKFTIDGENVSGGGYIIPANSYIDIHRHADKDAKFKFVGIDSPDAVDFGKNKSNTINGIVEARFYFEKPQQYANYWYNYTEYPNLIKPTFGECKSFSLQSTPTMSFNSLQEGCTVEGAMSGQMFTTAHVDLEAECVCLRLTLRGFSPENPAQEATIMYCTNCGNKKSRSSDNFCGLCGHKF